jgi:effector-binding domain-containing protein
MKILKKIVIVIVILIALPLIAALFINGEYAVVRETNISKSKQEVFDYIKYLKNQDNFSVWSKIDPEMKKGFEGEDGTIGCYASWESTNEEVGKGEQEITGITEGERIDFELRFMEPFESTDYAYFTTASKEDGSTTVQWGFNGKMPYPMNLMLLFMNMEEMLAPSLEEGLANLKEILEKTPSAPAIEITQVEVTAQPILYIEEETSLNPDSIKMKIGNAYGEIMALMSVAQLDMAGAPMAITTEFHLETLFWKFNAAIPANYPEDLKLDGRIKSGLTYAGKAVKGVHLGAYTESMATYNAIEKYIKDNNLEFNGEPWEEYIDDPMEVKEEDLKTNIYFPIK